MHIKICGLTTLDDALAAVAAGADYVGFNFYPPSPRYVTPEACAQMTAGLRARGVRVKVVGIFVHETPAEAARLMAACGLDLAQLHGRHGLADLRALGGRAFMAVRDPAGIDLDALAAHGPGEPALLLDANAPGAYGGTGRTADWSAARAAAERHAIFLAGGLRPGNVAEAVARVRPWGLDVASGVESAPGRKDPAKMQAFVHAARQANGWRRDDEPIPDADQTIARDD
jgi:phosphoribosylanthranilate isomerase